MKIARYSRVVSVLHWIVGFVFVTNYIVSEGMPKFFDQHIAGVDVSGYWVANFHTWVGISFMGLVLLRVVFRLISHTPEPIKGGNPRLEQLATLAHYALYVLMVLVPVSGIIAWYGKIAIFGDIHVVLMNLMVTLVGLHILAAPYHHFILKDNTLNRISVFR